MFKKLVPALLCISLAACTSDGELITEEFNEAAEGFVQALDDFADAVNGRETIVDDNGNTIDLFTIAGTGRTETVDSSNNTDLTISGAGNTINVETDLGTLILGGSNNIIVFSDNVSIDSCAVSGSDNTAEKPDSVNLSCDVSGSGNIGF